MQAFRPQREAELVELLAAPGPAFELVGGGTKRGVGRPVKLMRVIHHLPIEIDGAAGKKIPRRGGV